MLPLMCVLCILIGCRTYAASLSGGDYGTVSDEESASLLSTEMQEDASEIVSETQSYNVSSGDYPVTFSSVSEDVVYTDLEEFEASSAYVDRFQYEILKKFEFIQYAAAIMIALLFLLLFKKK
jgi:hypothetical protein